MALIINTNTTSLNAQRKLKRSSDELHKTFQRLSSGLRINSAADDAAGLAITNRFTAQVRGLNQAARNANDAISLLQVAEGALDETTSALQRMRELAVQAANDTYSSSDRASLQEEVDAMLAEINRIRDHTEWNTMQVLDGTFSNKTFHVGAFKSQAITFSIDSAGASALGVSGLSVGTQSTANSAISELDAALDSISDMRSSMGALQNRFESIIVNLNNVAENIAASRSRIQDADIAVETSRLTKNNILQQAGTAVLAQANQQPQLALQLLG
jgi:flagellin